MKHINKRLIALFAVLPLTACNEYICGSRPNYKPANFVSFFEKRATIDDRVSFYYKAPDDEKFFIEECPSAPFKSNGSDQVIGLVLGYYCDYSTQTGLCTLSKTNDIISMNLEKDLSAASVGKKCLEKLNVVEYFSSNDIWLAVGDYYLKQEYWIYTPCLYYRSVTVRVTRNQLEEDTQLLNGIKGLLGNNEEEYSEWAKKSFNAWDDDFYIELGMNGDESRFEPDIYLGYIHVQFPKDSETYAWSNKTENQS